MPNPDAVLDMRYAHRAESMHVDKKCPCCGHDSPDEFPLEAGFKYHAGNCPWGKCTCGKRATRYWYGCCSETCLGNTSILVTCHG